MEKTLNCFSRVIGEKAVAMESAKLQMKCYNFFFDSGEGISPKKKDYTEISLGVVIPITS
jgi:hypothetical protein